MPGADPSVQAVSPQVTKPSTWQLVAITFRRYLRSFHQMAPTVAHISFQLTTHLSTLKGWKAELAGLVNGLVGEWLTCMGWFTRKSGHPSAASQAWDRESSPTRDRRSTTTNQVDNRTDLKWYGQEKWQMHTEKWWLSSTESTVVSALSSGAVVFDFDFDFIRLAAARLSLALTTHTHA